MLTVQNDGIEEEILHKMDSKVKSQDAKMKVSNQDFKDIIIENENEFLCAFHINAVQAGMILPSWGQQTVSADIF